jgi:hypothetical protein
VITLQRPGHSWPLLLAANRDERLDRPWDAPGAHWPDQPDIVGGRDRLGGGSWMGINAAGVVAAVLNRTGSLGPAPGKRSRGELPLLGLRHSTAASAASAIVALDGRTFRSFNFVAADRDAVWFVRNDDAGQIEATALPAGLHMITAHDPDDLSSARVERHLPRWRDAAPPQPPDWANWVGLLADETGPRAAALSVPPENGFGTASASLLGIAASGAERWLFAAGRAGRVPFTPVALPAPRVAGGSGGCYTAPITQG